MAQVLPPALAAMLPQSYDAYVATVVSYNEAVWPAHILALAGMVGVYELTRTSRHARGGLLMFVLACAWAWTGWSFLGRHLDAPFPITFLFALEAVFFAVAILFNPPLRLDSASARAGHALVIAAVFLIPAVILLQGRGIEEIPYFGLSPLVTAMATLGAVMVLRGWFRWVLALIPIGWIALVAYGAAQLEDGQLLLGPVLAAFAVLIAMLGAGPERSRA